MGANAGARPQSTGWELVYEWTNFVDESSFAYDIDNSSGISSFSRILYQMKYGKYSVWCEMDDHSSSDVATIGYPDNYYREANVTNMYVWVNNPDTGFPNATQSTIYNRGPVTGRINFWPSNYGTTGGNSSLYDHDDSGYSTADGYGSFQVFDINPSTPECIFAWNRWYGGESCDIGIGTNGYGAHPDWTFMVNGASFTPKVGRIWVK
jgi:hypothetical protein